MTESKATGLLERDTNFHRFQGVDLDKDFILRTSLLVAIDDELAALPGIQDALNFAGEAVYLGPAEILERTFSADPEKRTPENSATVSAKLYQVPSEPTFTVLNKLIGYNPLRLDIAPRVLKTVALASPRTEAKIYMMNL